MMIDRLEGGGVSLSMMMESLQLDIKMEHRRLVTM